MDSFHSPLLLPPLQTGRLPLLSDNNGDQRILISSSNNSFLNNNDNEEDGGGGGGGSDGSADDVGGHEYIAVAASSAERRSCSIVADDNNANDDGAGGVRRGCFGDSSNVVYDSSDDSARVANPATVRQHNKFTLATPSKTIRTRCSKTICWQFLASVIYTLLYVSTSPCLAAKQEGKYALYTQSEIRFICKYTEIHTTLLLKFRNSYTSRQINRFMGRKRFWQVMQALIKI